jgi:glycosyltransferase involved in cell wall biosynthesis
MKSVSKYCKELELVRVSSIWSLIYAVFSFFIQGRSVNESYFYDVEIKRAVEKVVKNVSPDVMHCCMIRTAQFGFQFSGGKTSIDFIDALSLNLERKIEESPWWKRWFWRIERRRVEALERKALEYFDCSFVTSEVDKKSLEAEKVRNELTIVPNGVDLQKFSPAGFDKRASQELVFTGNMSYTPNVKAVTYFAEKVLPFVRDKYPNVDFKIAGAAPVRAVSRLDKLEGVEVLGFVDSIAECLQNATIAVCPLQSGAGIQNKVLEAMATGTPVVATPIAVEGIRGGEDGIHYVVGEEAEQFATQVNYLLADSEFRIQLGGQARRFMEEHYTWKAQVEKMIERLRH